MAVAMAVAMVMMVMHPDLGALGTTGVMAIMMMVVMRVMMVMMMAMHVLLTPVRMIWSRPSPRTRKCWPRTPKGVVQGLTRGSLESYLVQGVPSHAATGSPGVA